MDKDIKLIKSEKNKTQFVRYSKKVLDCVNGERIWYIDVDDSLEIVDEEFNKYLNYDEDIICFLQKRESQRDCVRTTTDFHEKWVKTEACRNNFKNFPEDATIVFHEDTIALTTFDQKSYFNVDKVIYNYLDNSENYGKNAIYDFETFNRCIGVGLPYYEKLLKNNEKALIELIYDICEYIGNFKNYSQYFEMVEKYFSKDIITKFFKKYSYCAFAFLSNRLDKICMKYTNRPDKIDMKYDKNVRSSTY